MSETKPIDELRASIDLDDVEIAEGLLRQNPSLANSLERTPPPLHVAVFFNRPRHIDLLVKFGANLELHDQDQQTTPVRYAIVYCRTDIIRQLTALGASLGPATADGTTALELAEQGAAGAFEEYPELPSREQYRQVLAVLRGLSSPESSIDK